MRFLWVLSSVLLSRALCTSPEAVVTISLTNKGIRAAMFWSGEKATQNLACNPPGDQRSRQFFLFEKARSGVLGILNYATLTTFLFRFTPVWSWPT